jgi:hypothetical protein
MIDETDADTSQARVYVRKAGGKVEVQHFTDQSLAYAVWLGLDRNVRAAFRGAGDMRPVYSWDFVAAR